MKDNVKNNVIDISRQAMMLGKAVEKLALKKALPVTAFVVVFEEPHSVDKTIFNYQIHFKPGLSDDFQEQMTKNLEAIINTMGETYESDFKFTGKLH